MFYLLLRFLCFFFFLKGYENELVIVVGRERFERGLYSENAIYNREVMSELGNLFLIIVYLQ